MKRLVILCTLALAMSCVCLPQLPDQTVYVDSTCSVELPDYTLLVKAQDNCDVVYLVQDPEPGTVFNYSGVIGVTITATDISGNVTSGAFEVFMIDTIAPRIIMDSVTAVMEVNFQLLDAFQASLKPYVSDSILNTHNLVMVFYPTGRYIGIFQPPNFYPAVPLTEEEIDELLTRF